MLCDAKRFLLFALTQDGKPYLWGADGPKAFDCGGLINWALLKSGGPDWRATHKSQDLFDVLLPELVCRPGQVLLAFYGKDEKHVEHVMICVGDGRVFGACGGNHTTTTLAVAAARKAQVRYRPSPTYRPDFIGYRSLELRQPVKGESPNA